MDLLSISLLILVVLLCIVGIYVCCLHQLLKNNVHKERLIDEETSLV